MTDGSDAGQLMGGMPLAYPVAPKREPHDLRSLRLRSGKVRMVRAGALFAALSVLSLSGCDREEVPAAKQPERPKAIAATKAPENICAQSGNAEQLKGLVFDGAKQVRADRAEVLDRLAGTVVARVENSSLRDRDEALDAAICKGRLVIELPPGTRDPFNASGRLAAVIAFAVQGQATSNRPVYLLDGAEPIIYRLAAIEANGAAPAAIVPIAPSVPRSRASAAPPQVRTASSGERKAGVMADAPPEEVKLAEPRRSGRGRPSFDCRSARSRVDRMICADERLAAYDRVLAPMYDRALERTNRQTRARLLTSQARFEAFRQRCGGPACIARAYQDRMDEIEDIVATR